MRRYSIEPRTRKYVKGHGFSLFARKYKKTIIEYRTRFFKTSSKKVVHKAGEFIENKTVHKTVKAKHVIDQNPRNVEEIIIPQKKEEKY